MNRFTLRFASAFVEAAYAEEHARKALRPVRIALVFLSAVTVAYYVLATHVFHGVMVVTGTTLLRGSVVALAAYAVVYALTHFPVFVKRQQLILFLVVCVMLSIGIARGIARYPLEVLEARGFVPMLFFTFGIYSVFRLRFPQAALAGWLGAGFYTGYLLGTDVLSAAAAARHAVILGLANLMGMLICYQMDVTARREFAAMRLLGEERALSERLLLNILPASIAERLKTSEAAIADHSEAVTVLFADIVGFTPLSARKTPQALVQMLGRIFIEFDALAEVHGLEKIKTIGDAYMAAAGLPERRADHAPAAARMALGMLEAVARIAAETGEALAVRIGLHSGPVVAGVIGRKKFIYDLWGDTVNTASRMESHGVPGAVHCSSATAALLRDGFALAARGAVQVDGKGEMHTFLLTSARRNAALANEAEA